MRANGLHTRKWRDLCQPMQIDAYCTSLECKLCRRLRTVVFMCGRCLFRCWCAIQVTLDCSEENVAFYSHCGLERKEVQVCILAMVVIVTMFCKVFTLFVQMVHYFRHNDREQKDIQSRLWRLCSFIQCRIVCIQEAFSFIPSNAGTCFFKPI